MFLENDLSDFAGAPPATSPSPSPFTYVKIGMIFGKPAIIEKSTEEPLQFITNPSQEAAIRLAAQWDLQFKHKAEAIRQPR